MPTPIGRRPIAEWLPTNRWFCDNQSPIGFQILMMIQNSVGVGPIGEWLAIGWRLICNWSAIDCRSKIWSVIGCRWSSVVIGRRLVVAIVWLWLNMLNCLLVSFHYDARASAWKYTLFVFVRSEIYVMVFSWKYFNNSDIIIAQKCIDIHLKGKFPQIIIWIGWVESNFTNPTEKVWTDLDNPFKRSDYAKLCKSSSLDGILPDNMISQEDNSPLTLYIHFHNFFKIFFLDISSSFDQVHS